jgi:hypothetical protein
MITRYCRRCGKMSEFEGELKFCPHCGAPFEELGEPPKSDQEYSQPSDSAGQPAPESGPAKYVAWEDKGRLGFFGALFETWKESLFNPTGFYRKMPVTGGVGNPLLYGLILGFIGLVFSMVYQQFFEQFFDPANWYPFMGRDFDWRMYEFSQKIESITNLAYILLFPVIIAAWFFIWSGIVHLILMIFGWKKENFEATFRLITYSEGPSFFAIIPVLGGLVSIIWQLVLVIIGVKEVHRLTVGQSLIVNFLPLLLCCFCCCGFFSWIIGMIGMLD